ncbi:MAG TPA: transcription factor [Methanomicrobiales archaeon]|nr:transcription factor [Methanomicrobiales archaeon]
MMSITEILEDEAVRSYLRRLIGEEGLDLLGRVPEEGEYSDEDLAEKTGINLNSVRHTLYTLYEKRLAEYRRLKNTETGWLTYLWTLRLDRVPSAIKEDMRMLLEKLEARESFEEENDFYLCKNCGTFTFNEVMELDFACPRCTQPVEHFDNEALLSALKRRISAIRECLGYE